MVWQVILRNMRNLPSINQCRGLIEYGVPDIHFYTVGAVENVKEVATAVY